MSTLSGILLLESSNILNQYSGIMSGMRNFGFTRELVPQVSQLVNDIQTKRISLREFSARLGELERLVTEDDILPWYIQNVREFIARTLQDMPEYLFPQENNYKFYYYTNSYTIFPSSENSHAFIIAYDMLQKKEQKTVALDRMINLKFGLHRLMSDEPVRTISLIWEKYQEGALNFLFNNASTANSVNALLDFLAALPVETNKTPWLTTFGNKSGQNLLSLTMECASERYNEVLGYLDGLEDTADKAKILLYSVYNSTTKKIINPVLSSCIHYPAALPAILTEITALPNKVDVYQFLKDCLNLVCQDPERWVTEHFNSTLIPRAESLFSAILPLPDKSFVFKILTMSITDHPGNTMARYIIKHSPKIFVQLLETAKSFDAGDERTQLMRIIFQEAMQSEKQSEILIKFLLSAPDLPKDFLQITTPGSHWNILHIVARYFPNQVQNMLDCIDKTIPEHKEDLLAGLSDLEYTPLMIAAAHEPAGVPYFLDALTLLPNCSTILKRIGLDKSSALTLVNKSGNNLTGNLVNDAIEGRYKSVATSSNNPLFFRACGAGAVVTAELKDETRPSYHSAS